MSVFNYTILQKKRKTSVLRFRNRLFQNSMNFQKPYSGLIFKLCLGFGQ